MPMKILVIDDERPTLSMFKLFLDAYGYEVFTAENGESGLEVFDEHRMPIVLTDIKMPGMDGLEVLKAIKERAPKTEVIIITGHGDMDIALEALSLDATDFINKPINQSNLDSALKRARERIRMAESEDDDFGVRIDNGVAVIDVKTAINSGSETRLTEAFATAREGAGKVVVSFSRNVSVNGAGIALLTQLLLDCRKRDIPTGLAGVTGNLGSVLDMVGITKLATLFDTEDEAVATL